MPAAVAVPLLVGAASTGASIYASKKSSNAASEAAKYQTQQGNYAADLEAKAAADALAFAKEQEAARQREFASTQARNYELYQADRARDDDRYNARQANLDPYRRWAVGSIGQLMRPIPRPGSIGSMVGG